MNAPDARSNGVAAIAAILATGYLRLQINRAKSPPGATLHPPDSALSPCYGVRPEA